jgi:uncharacterized protein YbjT (DUF2867 family)
MKEVQKKVLVAGATGYLGKYVVKAFKERGYYVRVLVRSESKLFHDGPFTAPALLKEDIDEIYVGEITRPETLQGVAEGMDLVFSSVGISRQQDGLTFEQVDYQGNMNLINEAQVSGVSRIVYVSMQGADQISHLEITRAHEKVVGELSRSGMDYRIVRPCGYFSDMGAVFDMAKKGRAYLVGKGENKMNPIHGADLAEVCVDAAEGDDIETVAGGPDIMTQRQAAELAFSVVGKLPKISVIPMWLARAGARLIRVFSRQFGDLADFIVTAGDVDGVGPQRGSTHLRQYFEELYSRDSK